MKQSFFVLILFLSANVALWAQNRSADAETANVWQLATSADGILVHFKEIPGNPVHEVKAETVVKGDIHEAFKILSDPMHILRADPYVKNPKLVGDADTLGAYYYGEIETPVLVKNRDFIIKAYASQTANGYFMAWKSAWEYLPEQEDLVRMKDLTIVLSLQPISVDHYILTYKISIGAEGGEIAINFANKALPESSLERLKAFRKLVSEETPLAIEAK